MNAGGRLALYGAGLVVTFGAAFVLADAIVPESFVASWTGEQVEQGANPGSLEDGH